jgi:thymidylate synthase ThyX
MLSKIYAKVLRDSTSLAGNRLTTFEIGLPRCILSELNTHRVFSRNFMSSRAIPVERMIGQVEESPFVPHSWGKNQSGMQAGPEHDAPIRVVLPNGTGELGFATPAEAWLSVRDYAVAFARGFAEAGYHKQLPNRLIEPWMYTRGVVSSTHWSNFFALRDHEAAEPHFRLLAKRMRTAIEASTPRPLEEGEWHLPYIDDGVLDQVDAYVRKHGGDPTDLAIRCSVARCARVSYGNHDGTPPSIQKDLELYGRLVGAHPLHASPAEHQATPDPYHEQRHRWGNFRGWVQHRKTLDGECL